MRFETFDFLMSMAKMVVVDNLGKELVDFNPSLRNEPFLL